jgi:hypothetical protein
LPNTKLNLKNKLKAKSSRDIAQLRKHLPSKSKVLSTNLQYCQKYSNNILCRDNKIIPKADMAAYKIPNNQSIPEQKQQCWK